MKKYLGLCLLLFAMVTVAYAEEPSSQAPDSESASAVSDVSQPAPVSSESPAVVSDVAVPAAAPMDSVGPTEPAEKTTPAAVSTTAAATSAAATDAAENLEFVSGEIGALDVAAKTATIKLYSDTENAGEKTVTVHLDDATDITDGEKDRDLKSLTPGTEVDVEYDPASSKATYIFVY